MPSTGEQPSRWQALAPTDLALALGLWAASLAELVLGGLPARAAAAAAVATLGLALRRSAPRAAVTLVAGAVVADEAAGGGWTDGANAPVFVVLAAAYGLGAHAPRAAARDGLILMLAGLGAAAVASGSPDDVTFLLLIVLMPFTGGRAVRRARERAERLQALTARLEGERATAERLAVTEERQRIAAEVHDRIGHAVSAMVVQAAAAEEVLAHDPPRARAALAALQDTGRQVVTDLRATLGALRRDGAAADRPAEGDVDVEPPPGSARRWPASGDAVLAWLALAAGVAVVLADGRFGGVRVAAVTVQGLAAWAIWRRERRPWPALGLALAAVAGEAVLIGSGAPTPVPLLAALLALYVVARQLPGRLAAVAWALTFAVPTVALVANGGDAADALLVGVVTAIPALAGHGARVARRRAAQLASLAERLRRERDARARIALLEERARVARDLHDSVAHAVSVMVLQAGAAGQVFADEPEAARAAARAIQDLGRESLADLQRLLRVLEAPVTTAPVEGMGRLDDLLARVRSAGLRVSLRVHGEPVVLPAGIDASAFRIVQESLTNALKHGRGGPTAVDLAYGPDALTLEIVSGGGVGGNGGAPGAAWGLAGMSERAALLDGSLDAGPAGDGGFAVRARLPLPAGR